MERIIMASSNPGDLVADFFGGAGTTAAVASRLNRQFISADTQPRALHTSRSRLVLDVQDQQTGKSTGFEHNFSVKIQREESAEFPPFSSLEELGIKPPEVIDGVITLPPDLISRVDYWEMDPDWDGEIFRSSFQAARPWRKGDIPASTVVPEKSGEICLRFVLIDGGQIQHVLKKYNPAISAG